MKHDEITPHAGGRQCVIVASRPVSQRELRLIEKDAFVIAVDAGWERAREAGILADMVLGDFDSSFPPEKTAVLRLPKQKDDTDTYFAAKWAVQQGYDKVLLLGGTGGRPDHVLANYQTLIYLAVENVRGCMADESSEVWCLGPGRYSFNYREGYYFSAFAVNGEATGVCLTGMKYPLENETLLPSWPIGVSNEFVEKEAMLSIQSGMLLVMLVKHDIQV